MHKLLVIPIAAYIQAWFELLQGNYITALCLVVLAFVVWLAVLDTKELLQEQENALVQEA